MMKVMSIKMINFCLCHMFQEARRDSASVAVSGTSSKHAPKSASAVHSTQSAPQAPAVSTTSSPRQEHCETYLSHASHHTHTHTHTHTHWSHVDTL